jgi:hypothetical protein
MQRHNKKVNLVVGEGEKPSGLWKKWSCWIRFYVYLKSYIPLTNIYYLKINT